MSYITLGNMRRFLNKLKGYLSNNYLQLSGGTVTGDTIFKKKISAHEVCLTGLSDVSLVNKNNGSIAKDGLTILDEGNYNLFTPTIHGTGATGTWDINISGNALNDSEGNKIIDTYAKKSDIPTKTSQLTNDSNYVSYTDVKALEVGNYLDLHDNNNMDVDYTFRILGNGQIIRQSGAYIQVLDSGHLSINGSELWVE